MKKKLLMALTATVSSLGVCSCRTVDEGMKRDIQELREERDEDYGLPRRRNLHYLDEKYALLNEGGERKYV